MHGDRETDGERIATSAALGRLLAMTRWGHEGVHGDRETDGERIATSAALGRPLAMTRMEVLMNLCEICEKGMAEMCPYFKEHFLESGAAVRSCPEFEAEKDSDVELLRGARSAGAARILTSRCVKKAMAGERVLILTGHKAVHGETILRAVGDSELKNKVSAVHICFENGGQIVIGGIQE